MQVMLSQIPMREILHFLGWHGTPVEPPLMEQIRRIRGEVLEQVKPRAVMRRFVRLPDGTLEGTRFFPQGEDVREMLSPAMKRFCWRQRWARTASACFCGRRQRAPRTR